jgi:mannose-1-phosphate guanylyltransferase
MNILIMAGGTGTRLWPASRKSKPKQLLKMVGDKTLLQNTFERCRQWTKPENIYVGTGSIYEEAIKAQLPEIPNANYSIEPVLRGRAPAIGLAALIMHHHDPEAVFMCMWSDHSIKCAPGYFEGLMKHLEQFLRDNPEFTITVGVKPTEPHTGLGYIEKGSPKENGQGLPLFDLASFKEKPNRETAQQFLDSGKYLWNSGYFVWKASTLLSLYQEHLPEIYDILMQIKPHLDSDKQQDAINEWYPKMPKLDIEQGLLEKLTGNVLALEGDFEWADIGSWKIIKDVLSEQGENLSKGKTLHHENENGLFYNFSDKILLAAVRTKDIIVVVTDEAVLVADKDSAEEVKEIIAQLEENPDLEQYL